MGFMLRRRQFLLAKPMRIGKLKPLTETFLSGALIVYAHSALQREAGLGYVSDWASENFSSVKEKNTFFEKVGEMLAAGDQKKLASCGNDSQPEEILNLIS